MTDVQTLARLGLSGVAVAETAATWTRWEQRRRLFLAADARARQLGRPLLARAARHRRAEAHQAGRQEPLAWRADDLRADRRPTRTAAPLTRTQVKPMRSKRDAGARYEPVAG